MIVSCHGTKEEECCCCLQSTENVNNYFFFTRRNRINCYYFHFKYVPRMCFSHHLWDSFQTIEFWNQNMWQTKLISVSWAEIIFCKQCSGRDGSEPSLFSPLVNNTWVYTVSHTVLDPIALPANQNHTDSSSMEIESSGEVFWQ